MVRNQTVYFAILLIFLVFATTSEGYVAKPSPLFYQIQNVTIVNYSGGMHTIEIWANSSIQVFNRMDDPYEVESYSTIMTDYSLLVSHLENTSQRFNISGVNSVNSLPYNAYYTSLNEVILGLNYYYEPPLDIFQPGDIILMEDRTYRPIYLIVSDNQGTIKGRIIELNLAIDGTERDYVIAGLKLTCKTETIGVSCKTSNTNFNLTQGNKFISEDGTFTLLTDFKSTSISLDIPFVQFNLLIEPSELICPKISKSYFKSHCSYNYGETNSCVINIKERCSFLKYIWITMKRIF